MTDMMRLTFSGSDKAVVTNLQRRLERVMPSIVGAMNASNTMLQAYIQGEKLSGQVLQHRSGKLFNSIRVDNAEVVGDKVEGSVAGAGGVAWYGQLHEFGGEFQAVRRSAMSFGKIGRRKRMTAQRIAGTAYTIKFPERSFMRTAFAEMRDKMVANIRGAMNEAMQ